MSEPHEIFVSYAREDQARVQPLVQAIEARGWSVFWDRELPPGSSWREWIGERLARARCVVVVWSRNSVASTFVAEEADEGRQRNALVPVLIDAVLPPLGLRSVHAADLSAWQGDAQAPQLAELLEAIERKLAPAEPGAAAARAAATPPQRSATARDRRALLLLAPAIVVAAAAALWTQRTERVQSPPAQPPRAEPTPAATPALDLRIDQVLWGGDAEPLSLQVRIANRSAREHLVEPQRSLRLLQRGGAAVAPTRVTPQFETLAPGAATTFHLAFPTSGAALSLELAQPGSATALRVELPPQPP